MHPLDEVSRRCSAFDADEWLQSDDFMNESRGLGRVDVPVDALVGSGLQLNAVLFPFRRRGPLLRL